ncbi:MAG: phosphatidylserine decarboxylase family protein [Planctomycetota bacterium]|nr:MAG: phosphatidylserine decarboxylase family protein [Planctomycetota bacterium]
MKWPFTTYATGTLLVSTLPLAALSVWLAGAAPGAWWLAPLPLLLFFSAFFRDPDRSAPGGEDELVAPADGVVADILEVDDPDLGGPALRLGIFLSVFNVHVNRVPCSGEVTALSQRDGGYFDARDTRAIDQNRAATIVLRRPDGRSLAVRQITGLIARRIICPVQRGDSFARGQRYGMIRFGSRTEVMVPKGELDSWSVHVGDSVKGGQTLIGRLRPAGGELP